MAISMTVDDAIYCIRAYMTFSNEKCSECKYYNSKDSKCRDKAAYMAVAALKACNGEVITEGK